MVSALDLLHLAKTAAEAAGVLPPRRSSGPADPGAWTLKGSRDFVTEVDRTAERMITEILLAAEPGGRIVGEELSPEVVTDGLVWVVDPLDGTTNFLHGFPSYAVSIAAAVDGVLEAGVVVHVPRDEIYTARAWRRRLAGRPPAGGLRHRRPGLCADRDRLSFQGRHRGWSEYLAQFAPGGGATSGIRRPGSAALDLADVAAGRFDGFWEQRLSAWDIAAGILLIREAGGMVTDFGGRDDRGRAHRASWPAIRRCTPGCSSW